MYDVAAIALPLEEDLKKLGDEAKATAEAQKAADEFVAALRTAINADETSLNWYAPGALLLFGSAEQHAALATQIAALEQAATKPAASLAKLSATTRKRFAARKEKIAKALAAERTLDVAAAHDQFSWQLVAAAAGGRLDLESLTELQIAWQAPQTAELLAGSGRPLALRSLWTICEAARALPAEQELTALAGAARAKTDAAIAALLTEAGANTANLPVLAGGIYAALANPDDAAYRAKLLTLLSAGEADEPTKELRLLGRLLLSEPTAADRQALGELVTSGVTGADSVALVALACRKVGGSAWDQFRARSRELIGEQPLPGEVVVLVNRLRALR
jgi:hypothetical protein